MPRKASNSSVTVNQVDNDQDFTDTIDELEGDLTNLNNMIDAGEYDAALDLVRDMRAQFAVFQTYLEKKEK